MKYALFTILTLALVAISSSSGANLDSKDLVNPRYNKLSADKFDISGDDISNVDDDSNDLLFNYDPTEPKYTDYFTTSRNANNKIKAKSYTNLERETIASSSSNNNNKRLSGSDAKVREVMSADGSGDQSSDRAKDIALNSREVRLVGPHQKEIEMKDDLPTKFVVAMENLGKEATQVWGQVNEKLDKGWTDLKTMVEGVVAPSSKQQPGRKEN